MATKTELEESAAAVEECLFLVHFAQIHETFRKAELEALAELHGIQMEWKDYSDSSPFAIISLPRSAFGIQSAQTLISRSILAKGIYTLWAQAPTYDALHASIRSRLPIQVTQQEEWRTFKFSVETFNACRSQGHQLNIIRSFEYLDLVLDGKRPCMKSPDVNLFVFEEFPSTSSSSSSSHELTSHEGNNHGEVGGVSGREDRMKRVFFGVKIADSARTGAIATYDLKKRAYIGTTSMDAELSLVTANIVHSAPGRLAYDPFVGTGSFLYACAHFGATTMGSDIDGRQIRGGSSSSRGGKGEKKNGAGGILGNFQQYGLVARYLDGFICDLTNTPIRKTRFLDCVICDPPYGVREGLKVLGSRDPAKEKEPVMVGGVMGHLLPDYIPPKRPYSFAAMLNDILQFAADHLVDGGRLAFWMPTANVHVSANDGDGDCDSEFRDEELNIPPAHPLMLLVAVCVQDFNKWSRKLLVYSRKSGHPSTTTQQELQHQQAVVDKKMTADELNEFRKKYFEGFKPPPQPKNI